MPLFAGLAVRILMPAEKTQFPIRVRNPEELSELLGIADSDFEEVVRESSGLEESEAALRLFDASGGFVSIAATVMDIAASTGMIDDVASVSFADYVAARTPALGLGLSGDDEKAAVVLAHMFSSFTKTTALLALSSLRPASAESAVVRDPEGTLMRLQMAGVLRRSASDADEKRLCVPSLLAGKLREIADDGGQGRQLVADLVSTLVGYVESSRVADDAVLSDALTLARRNGEWQVLGRLYRSFGLGILLRAPNVACSAYAGLPSAAVASEPDLELLARITAHLQTRVQAVGGRELMRQALVEETGPDRLSEHLAVDGASTASIGDDVLTPERGYHPMVLHLLALARSGRHAEAVAAGTSWLAGCTAWRAQQVIRLLVAISHYHSSQPHFAMSVLREVEEEAARSHVDGDFLLPATLAWLALISAATGDVEYSDELLRRLDSEFEQSTVVDEIVSPPKYVASALRALDRLDLTAAQREMGKLANYPELHSLVAFPAGICRLVAVLSETSESGLLHFHDQGIGLERSKKFSDAGRAFLIVGRCLVFIGLGQLKLAEIEFQELPETSDSRVVLAARLELVAGRYERVIAIADSWFYHESLRPRSRAEIAAIKAAALLRSGQKEAAVAEFGTAVGLAAVVGSLLPIALLPQRDRVALIESTSDDEIWDDVLSSTHGHFQSRWELRKLLCEVGVVAVAEATMPQLTSAEGVLLGLLDQGMSVSQISTELSQVTGTVKNRLSALYRKFEVSSREEVILRARALGFLNP
ncbi:hypothetical protein A2T55_16295 [Brevibacterium linens]|uniref:HTH luxR-type domain-containing protein n=2 Tax=Brevibacterium linens TaxID=1703 RepID=A0A144MIA2_BRELN|nr:hypothetical protein A2T55_16295 [Brevibacterium linens]